MIGAAAALGLMSGNSTLQKRIWNAETRRILIGAVNIENCVVQRAVTKSAN
jgi:hypothetical protein